MKASLLMLLIVAIVSGQQSETHIDFFNDQSLKEDYNVSRVEQIVDVTYPTPSSPVTRINGGNSQTWRLLLI